MEVTIQSNGLKLFQVRGKNNFVFIWRFQNKVVSLHHQTETGKQMNKEAYKALKAIIDESVKKTIREEFAHYMRLDEMARVGFNY